MAEEQKEAEKQAKEKALKHEKELAELAEEQERKKAERLKRAIDSEPKEFDFSGGSKGAINFISEGLMHLVRVFMLTVWMAILSSIISLITLLSGRFEEGAVAIPLLICFVVYLILVVCWFTALGNAFRAFRNGAIP
ncbi:MAG: hypothetical protein ACKO5E_16245 [bacterium]